MYSTAQLLEQYLIAHHELTKARTAYDKASVQLNDTVRNSADNGVYSPNAVDIIFSANQKLEEVSRDFESKERQLSQINSQLVGRFQLLKGSKVIYSSEERGRYEFFLNDQLNIEFNLLK